MHVHERVFLCLSVPSQACVRTVVSLCHAYVQKTAARVRTVLPASTRPPPAARGARRQVAERRCRARAAGEALKTIDSRERRK